MNKFQALLIKRWRVGLKLSYIEVDHLYKQRYHPLREANDLSGRLLCSIAKETLRDKDDKKWENP